MDENEAIDFNKIFEEKREKIEDYLHKFMESIKDRYTVREAIEYSLFAGGKRVRPILAMAVCELLGGDENKILPFACALELIHTYSLIHDDLPALDNDDFRRGKESCHKKYGEPIAILAGDALQPLAYEVMAQSDEEPKIILECIRTLAVASGITGLVGGQELDLFGERETTDQLQKINLLKTGALIAASCWIGAIIAGGDIEDFRRVGAYAKNIGIAFQVKDDLLDATGTRENTGKTPGTDEKNGIKTFYTLLGEEAADQLLEKYVEDAKMEIHTYGEKSYFLQDLANFIRERNN